LYGEIANEKPWLNELLDIEDDTSWPSKFRDDLKALGDVKRVHLRINSPGGDVFAAHTILNLLKNHPAKVTTHIDGLAASAASIVAMAGDEVIMPSNGMMMIHNPQGCQKGDARDMQDMASILNKVRDGIVAVYQDKTGMERQAIINLMNAETWMSADQAKELGFVDTISDCVDVAACAGSSFKVNGQEMDFGKMRVWPGALLATATAAAEPDPEPAAAEPDPEPEPAPITNTAVPIHTPNTAPPDTEWDADAAEDRIRTWAGGEEDMDWTKYRTAFAWYDSANQDQFGSYKLLHHDIQNGELVTIWNGVVAAAEAVDGARGGVDIPEEDIQGVKQHLARHYGQFDEIPPWEQETSNKGDNGNAAPGGAGPGSTDLAALSVTDVAADRARMLAIDELARGIPGADALALHAKYETGLSAAEFAAELLRSDLVRNMSIKLQRLQDANDSNANGVRSADPGDGDDKTAIRNSIIERIAQGANQGRK
jgi:ATP-dependent Clp protease protease subunit